MHLGRLKGHFNFELTHIFEKSVPVMKYSQRGLVVMTPSRSHNAQRLPIEAHSTTGNSGRRASQVLNIFPVPSLYDLIAKNISY